VRPVLAVARCAQPGRASAIGVGRRPAADAAFANGALGNVFEMDDIHRTSIVHAGDVVIPAAQAAAEEAEAEGEALLAAVVAGYAAAIRIGAAAGAGHYRHWYNTATCGIFGAAVAAGRVLRLDAGGLRRALSHAGMQSSGLWQCRLEPGAGKQLATAHAAAAGLRAAQLAAAGTEGPRAIFEGPLGFFAAMAPEGDPVRVAADPDAGWCLFDVSFKPWPACRHAHPAIEAALDLRRRGQGGEVAAVDIATYAAAVAFCDDPAPDTPQRGRFSLQHAFAVAWLRGAPSLADFEPPSLADAATAALRQRVTVIADGRFTRGFPEAYGARVTVRLSDGRELSREVATARGDPENPLSAAELAGKAEGLLAAAGLSGADIARLEDAVRGLPGAPTLARLTEALTPLTRPGPPASETDHAARQAARALP
jgi:2-methylcitrate dehydratase PrpD